MGNGVRYRTLDHYKLLYDQQTTLNISHKGNIENNATMGSLFARLTRTSACKRVLVKVGFVPSGT